MKKNEEILTADEIATLKAARKIMKKLQKKIDKITAIRAECDETKPIDRTSANGKKWSDATNMLYAMLDKLDKHNIWRLKDVNGTFADGNYLVLIHTT